METDPPNERPLVPEKEGNYSRENLARCFIFPALGGFLYGYDIGATAVALDDMGSEQWSGTSWHAAAANSVVRGVIVSAVMVGAALGSLLVLRYETDWGRVKEMRLASALYGAGALVEGLSGSPGLSAPLGLTVLLFGRVVYGVGIGLAMHGAPTYIAETAPPSIRGALVSAKEAIIVLGLTVGYAVGGVPRSPRWCLLRGYADEARAAYEFVTPVPAPGAFERLAGHVRALKADEVTGQPSVLYYVTEIFEDYDLGVGASIGLSAWKLVATMLTVRLIDSYGRVPLLQRGSAIMIASMGSLAVAALFLDMASGALAWTSIVTLSLYVGGYQVGYGPVTWTYISEVFPLQPRGSALALAVLLNFSLNGVVTLLASPLIAFSVSFTFFVFGALAVYGTYFIHAYVPETKGLELEQITTMLTQLAAEEDLAAPPAATAGAV
ncbi:hypothetical protein JL722_2855 [Aureococcus anophagefferens]|nr:hypothetical protein JL722_2855 [Aureococcus anophagefferens]